MCTSFLLPPWATGTRWGPAAAGCNMCPRCAEARSPTHEHQAAHTARWELEKDANRFARSRIAFEASLTRSTTRPTSALMTPLCEATAGVRACHLSPKRAHIDPYMMFTGRARSSTTCAHGGHPTMFARPAPWGASTTSAAANASKSRCKPAGEKAVTWPTSSSCDRASRSSPSFSTRREPDRRTKSTRMGPGAGATRPTACG
mmetsp:Transcript_8349/g.32933  ORF Transcript_8349/g.32933 Transcript_8349/m.32933 type:complete len:203 (+) Transcript_8349:419-1027(+)